MEITLLIAGAAAFACWLWTSWVITFFIGFSIALCYGRWYWDGSEYDGKKEWPAFRKLRIWSVLHWYFSHEIRFVDEFETRYGIEKSTEKYVLSKFEDLRKEGLPCMFAVHPHGLFTMSGPVGFGLHGGRTDGMPKLYIGVSSMVFFFPILRELFLWMGAVDVGRKTVEIMLDRGNFVGLAPGGVREMILSKPGSLDLFLGHEGFLKIAYEKKVPIAPVFARGENDVFFTFTTPVLSKLRSACVSIFGYPLPSFFIGPRRTRLTTFCGEPMYPLRYNNYEYFKYRYYQRLFTLIENVDQKSISDELRKKMEHM